ncbi:MAG: L,D-transpeptidase/peptidoglycan binding protein [Lachnospiraceae bacterium]|nr:L,D-transpeptidase/peptidoglycan binding protein [Lachnospiraceae bacterium]MBP3458970.1 L,D-transpeptidase/peptidoglycan binding protein [Lachnospiraceae bacterium]
MRGKSKKILISVVAGLAVLLLGGYLAGAVYYGSHLMNGTKINGIAVSGKTPAQVKKAMEQYELTIYEKAADGSILEQKITGEQLGLEMTDEAAIKNIIQKQGGFSWILKKDREYQVGDLLSLDEQKLSQAVNSLKGFAAEEVQEAKDAYISDYVSGKGYEIVKETEGNQLNQEVTLQKVKEAVLTLAQEIDLSEAGCYEQPKVTSEDKTLNRILKQLNTYTSTQITYTFGDDQEVLDGNTIHNWLKLKKNKAVVQKAKVEEYVTGLRRKYDTIFTNRTFQTSYGKKVSISGGDYGWWMNTAKETAKIQKLIKKGKKVTRTPEYIQEAASYGENDYGDSYVEINLTAQHLFVYQNGKKVLESDFVSGNVSAGNGTPAGVYALTYKEEIAELVGENYATPVSYWMPFNGNIGMHDATWRSQFGASLYKTGGSHGCVNLPYAVAKKIYSYVEKGSPVICYELKGTESSHITGQSDEQIATAVIESINKIGKVTSASRKRIEHSRAIYNRLSYSQRKLVTNYNKLVEAERKLRG